MVHSSLTCDVFLLLVAAVMLRNRYVVVGKHKIETLAGLATGSRAYEKPPMHKTSVVCLLPNTSGAIFKIVAQFATRDLNIVKLETRPACSGEICWSSYSCCGGSVSIRPFYFPFIHFSFLFCCNREFSCFCCSLGSLPFFCSHLSNLFSAVHSFSFLCSILFSGGTAVYSSNPKHWDLLFYIDFEASPLQATNDAVMGALREFSVWMRELGTYRTCAQDKLEVCCSLFLAVSKCSCIRGAIFFQTILEATVRSAYSIKGVVKLIWNEWIHC